MLVALALGMVAAFFGAARVWVRRDPLPEQADAIIVIGGDHKPERMARVAELYRAGVAPVILISAGVPVVEGGVVVQEYEVMLRQADELGLPRAVIEIERTSANTYENASFTHALARERGWRSIVLVTSAYHSRRAGQMFADVYGGEITVSVQPAQQVGCPPCWVTSFDDAVVLAYELRNALAYGVFGR